MSLVLGHNCKICAGMGEHFHGAKGKWKSEIGMCAHGERTGKNGSLAEMKVMRMGEGRGLGVRGRKKAY